MEHYSERLITYKRRSETAISASCIVLCLIFLLVLGFLPVLSAGLTRFFRPAFILISLLGLRSGIYKFGAEKWMIVNLVYYIAIFFSFPITSSSFETVVSMELFGLFFILAAARPWNRREIQLLIITTVIACCICAIVVLYSNPSLLRAGGNQHIRYLSTRVNRNPIAFSLVPGALCAAIMALNGRRRPMQLVCAAACLLCSYTAFALGCRSAFYSLALGLFLIIWEASRRVRGSTNRLATRVLIMVCLLLIVVLTFNLTVGMYSERLFDISDSSGREEIWDEARALIQEKPVFGGGYDYWESTGHTMGTHNTFLTIMLCSGYIGGVLLAIFLLAVLFDAFKVHSLIPLAFVAELLCHTYTEAGMDYYAYIPLVFAYIILRYIKCQKKDVSSIFGKAELKTKYGR